MLRVGSPSTAHSAGATVQGEGLEPWPGAEAGRSRELGRAAPGSLTCDPPNFAPPAHVAACKSRDVGAQAVTDQVDVAGGEASRFLEDSSRVRGRVRGPGQSCSCPGEAGFCPLAGGAAVGPHPAGPLRPHRGEASPPAIAARRPPPGPPGARGARPQRSGGGPGPASPPAPRSPAGSAGRSPAAAPSFPAHRPPAGLENQKCLRTGLDVPDLRTAVCLCPIRELRELEARGSLQIRS